MIRMALGWVLICAFARESPAAESSENGKAQKPNAVAVSQLLKQAAKSPLGPGEARLLRAVAELVEKEQAATVHRGPTTSLQPPVPAEPSTLAPQPSPPMPGPAEQRKRLAIRLSHVPVADVVKALEGSFDSEQRFRSGSDLTPHPDRVVLVPEPVTNSLLISGTPKTVNSLMGLIAKLDIRPDSVMAQICIANFVILKRDAKSDAGLSDVLAAPPAPSMGKDGAAWLAWAKEHGRLEVLSRPQIMTLVNQPAMIRIGTALPRGAPKASTSGPPRPSTAGPAKLDGSEPTEAGVTIGVTPSISPEGLIVIELDIEQTSLVNRDEAGAPIIATTKMQTTISAKDGQTVIVGGVLQRSEDAHRRLIIAVTPRVNPAR